ncbi:hypothetical protein EYC80_005117 [Monilinia laxa]|uniref:Uncharacterized protein n=1 Tax=Monilinia laxa TaxID=61186 RepID=A0A5N6KIY4_MONLA|nr:hypothetical protein EYC80_005117 [Monilinia laxa]
MNLPRVEVSKEKDLSNPFADERLTALRKQWKDLEARPAQRQIPEPEPGEEEEDDGSKLSDKSEGEKEKESESESEIEQESENESVGEGAGAPLHMKPYTGGRRFFHNEAESPQILTEELREQSESTQPFIHELYRLKPSKDPTFASETAVRNALFSFSNVVVNNPFSKNDLAVWSWKRIVIIVVTGILLGDLGDRPLELKYQISIEKHQQNEQKEQKEQKKIERINGGEYAFVHSTYLRYPNADFLCALYT